MSQQLQQNWTYTSPAYDIGRGRRTQVEDQMPLYTPGAGSYEVQQQKPMATKKVIEQINQQLLQEQGDLAEGQKPMQHKWNGAQPTTDSGTMPVNRNWQFKRDDGFE